MVLGMQSSLSVSKAVQLLKGASSKWFERDLSGTARLRLADGYGASRSEVPVATAFDTSLNSVEHHRTRHFKRSIVRCCHCTRLSMMTVSVGIDLSQTSLRDGVTVEIPVG
jgi:hypothetical protein